MQRIRIGRILFGVTLAFGLAAGGLVRAEDPKPAGNLPTGEQIMEDYIKATGGRAAYEKLENSVMEGTFEMPAMGMKGPTVVYAAKPNRMFTSSDMAQVGKSLQGCDGETIWAIEPMQGPRILEGEEREMMLRSAIFNAELHYKEIYDKIECVGEEKVGEADCYKVVRTPKVGKPETVHFDKKTHLPVKTTVIMTNQMGEIPVESTPGDFKEVDGVLVAHTLTQNVMNMEFKITFSKVDYNVDLPPDIFALPPEVKALKESKAAPGAGAAPDAPAATPAATPATEGE